MLLWTVARLLALLIPKEVKLRWWPFKQVAQESRAYTRTYGLEPKQVLREFFQEF